MTFRIQVFFYQRSEHDIKTGQLHTLLNQSAIQNFKIHRTLEQQQFLHKIGLSITFSDFSHLQLAFPSTFSIMR